jgi:hypothetical protein
LYSSELLCIDSGGKLPPYKTDRGVKDLVMRFLCPEVNDKRIVGIIYVEIMMHLFILLGLLGFGVECVIYEARSINPFVVSVLHSSSERSRMYRIHELLKRKMIKLGSWIRYILLRCATQNTHHERDIHNLIYDTHHLKNLLQVTIVAIGFTIIFVGLSSLCGFARLRLPIEPFFIMLSLMFWMKILGKERG